MKIKICGIKYKDNLEQIIPLNPDYLGFIFYPKSSRYMKETLAVADVKSIPNQIKKVGVFVNESVPELLKAIKEYDLNAVQLHGDEPPEYLADVSNIFTSLNMKVDIIKAFGIDENFELQKLNDYKQYCNFFLFDTKTPKYGGSGQKFNWQLLAKYDNEIPLLISGGIDVEDLEDIAKLKHLNIEVIDMNSKLEIEPGRKNINRVEQAIQIVKNKS
ncbi:MAG: phosphoribosylanthranilate isomerase [Chitinophagales bacterium]